MILTTLILRITINNLHIRIRLVIAQEQCGFAQHTGTRKVIFMMRMLTERGTEMQENLYLCFIDCTKLFDTESSLK